MPPNLAGICALHCFSLLLPKYSLERTLWVHFLHLTQNDSIIMLIMSVRSIITNHHIQLAGSRVTAYTDTTSLPYPTIRHISCEFLVSTASRCPQCSKYQNTLRKMVSRTNQRKPDALVCPSSHANYRYLQHNEKDQRLHNMHSLYQNTKSKPNRLRVKIAQASSISGIQLDKEMDIDDMAIIIYLV